MSNGMSNGLLWIALSGAILFTVSGLLTVWAQFTRRESLRNMGLYALTLLGPLTLGICWKSQMQIMADETVLWARLMSGDVSKIWAIGSLGLIVGTGMAVGALSLQDRARGIFLGAFAFALLWIVFYLHPTPHYVPMPAWLDKLVWFGLTVGGAAFCLIIYLKYQSYLALFQTPAVLVAGIIPLLAIGYPVAIIQAQQTLDLSQFGPREQIQQMGCLSCHTLGETGFPSPGEGLESVASRSEDVVRAFLTEPTAENAQRLGIRENPTGEMVGVHLSESEVNTLTEAMKVLFEIQPPSLAEDGWEQVESILTAKTCLACHSLSGEGAPQGGIGGPLENAVKYPVETMIEWLKAPTAENAIHLKIRETPMGAMASFALDEEQAKQVAEWIQTMNSE